MWADSANDGSLLPRLLRSLKVPGEGRNGVDCVGLVRRKGCIQVAETPLVSDHATWWERVVSFPRQPDTFTAITERFV